MVEFVESLAGTGKKYVLMQGKIVENTLHIQVKHDKEINRPYGFAYDIELPADLAEAIDEYAPRVVKSLANTGVDYFLLQAKPVGDGTVHFQIELVEEYNREYGAAFDVEDKYLNEVLREMME